MKEEAAKIIAELMRGETEEELSHFGVVGMKWGVRKDRRGLLSRFKKRRKKQTSIKKQEDTKPDDKQNAPKKKPGEEHAEKLKLQRKKVSEMTNAELKLVNERMQLEKQYKQLSKEEVGKGKQFVIDVLTNSAKTTATSLTSKYMMEAVEKAITKGVKS